MSVAGNGKEDAKRPDVGGATINQGLAADALVRWVAGHFLPGEERRTYLDGTATLDMIRKRVRTYVAEHPERPMWDEDDPCAPGRRITRADTRRRGER